MTQEEKESEALRLEIEKSIEDNLKAFCTDNEKIKKLLHKESREQKSKILKLIVEEINITQSEGQATSRLTSLYNKVNSL